ncbi:hypothetical protein AOQ73_28195 [Bradyrhizobium pachyrhizi]|nr:hypothetical protein AOQ73_28195 [Bradyrhizobium pachyrhizi]
MDFSSFGTKPVGTLQLGRRRGRIRRFGERGQQRRWLLLVTARLEIPIPDEPSSEAPVIGPGSSR